jgi:hypothetical protein
VEAGVRELIEEHVVASLLKQERLHATLGGRHRFSMDLEEGWFEAGSLRVAADVVGTQSLVTGTFVWGWANPSTPDAPAAEAVRQIGAERGIDTLTSDDELPEQTMHAGAAALIASGVAGLDGYYLARTPERALAFGLRSSELRRRPIPVAQLPSALLEAASVLEFSARRTFAHYLARPLPEVPAAIEAGRAVLRGADGAVSVSFDRDGRLGEIRADLPGSA